MVITGTGVITPIGLSVSDFWSSLLAGRTGVDEITSFDASHLPTRIAAEVRGFNHLAYMPYRVGRRLDKFAQFGLAAGLQAVEEAKLDLDDDLVWRTGALLGSAYGPGQFIQTSTLAMAAGGPQKVPAYMAAAASNDSAAGALAMQLGLRGPSAAVSTACATGATCIGDAFRQIRHGYSDVMLAGGTDSTITPLDMVSASNTGALSRRNGDPSRASRPFDRDRDGFVMGAGAGVVVLEEAEFARRRGAPILAELAGYGATTDVHHPTAPDPTGTGARAAIRAALDDAELGPDDIDYVNAHGTSTVINDRLETAVLRSVFGDRATRIPISSIKSMTGHMIGAAGAVELIATARAAAEGVVPPTVNCDDPEDTGLNFVPHEPQEHRVRAAISNSFGFGGHNAVLVVRPWAH
nr:beta-ketoacyl-ACP synthase II [Salinispora vitiensis]